MKKSFLYKFIFSLFGLVFIINSLYIILPTSAHATSNCFVTFVDGDGNNSGNVINKNDKAVVKVDFNSEDYGLNDVNVSLQAVPADRGTLSKIQNKLEWEFSSGTTAGDVNFTALITPKNSNLGVPITCFKKLNISNTIAGGKQCYYNSDTGKCFSGNCLDGSQNCSFNVNCGFVPGLSVTAEQNSSSCALGGNDGDGGGNGGGGGSPAPSTKPTTAQCTGGNKPDLCECKNNDQCASGKCGPGTGGVVNPDSTEKHDSLCKPSSSQCSASSGRPKECACTTNNQCASNLCGSGGRCRTSDAGNSSNRTCKITASGDNTDIGGNVNLSITYNDGQGSDGMWDSDDASFHRRIDWYEVEPGGVLTAKGSNPLGSFNPQKRSMRAGIDGQGATPEDPEFYKTKFTASKDGDTELVGRIYMTYDGGDVTRKEKAKKSNAYCSVDLTVGEGGDGQDKTTVKIELAEDPGITRNVVTLTDFDLDTAGNVLSGYVLSDPTPGIKNVCARFTPNEGEPVVKCRQIEILGDDPDIETIVGTKDGSTVSCKITGTGFGQTPGITSSDGTNLTLSGNWTQTEVTGVLSNAPDQASYPITLTRFDGKTATGTCSPETPAIISVGSNYFCPAIPNHVENNVKFTIYDGEEDSNNEKLGEQTVTIDANGDIKGLTYDFIDGKHYIFSIESPRSLIRYGEFTASNQIGLTQVVEAKLPMGDIAPAPGGNGVINSQDYSLLKNQWSLLSEVDRSGDFNDDTRVNSVDWACMRIDFQDGSGITGEDQTLEEFLSGETDQ